MPKTEDKPKTIQIPVFSWQLARHEGEVIKGVEVLRTGTFQAMEGPVTYTDADLELIVAAFDKVGFAPALKVDVGGGRPAHAEGGPAFGWVTALRKSRNKLLADIEIVDEAIFEMVRNKQFERVSVEIIQDFKRNGRIFPFVLGAIELLGASIPAVPNLKPVSESIGLVTGNVKRFAVDISKEEPDMAGEKEKLEKEKAAAAKLVKDKDAEIVKLKADIAASTEAEKKRKEEEAAKLKADDENATTLTAMATRVETLEREKRETVLLAIQGTCKVPSIRHEVSVIAGWALGKAGTVKLANEKGSGPGEKDGAPIQLLRDLIVKVNKFAEYVMIEHTTGAKLSEFEGDGAEDFEPTNAAQAGAVVDQKALAMVAKGEAKDYKEALPKVLLANPKLKKLYGTPTAT